MRRNHWSVRKISAALARGYFRTADLFAGCGGMTLGFHRAQFSCVVAVEENTEARNSHVVNFRSLAPEEGYAAHENIKAVDPEEAIQHLRKSAELRTRDAIDIVIGGPPCQAYSRLGRAALWDRAGKKFAHAEDDRATLYEHFLYYVAALRPVAFVMENVPEIGRFAHKNIAEEIALTAEETLGYTTRYALLNAAWYGVPQFRERMFIIGVRRELDIEPQFPVQTHSCVIPSGYVTSRAGSGHSPVVVPYDHFVDHAVSEEDRLLPAVTAAEALQDLPEIKYHLSWIKGQKRPELTSEIPYSCRSSDFGMQMRSWPHFSSNGASNGHVIRLTPRDYEIFRRMEGGDMYPEAIQIAEEIFEERRRAEEMRLGVEIREGDTHWTEIRKATVPPYKVTRYPNKFRKIEQDKPVRTVPAHLGRDCYSHIHFDSAQARTISVREAARLQSFPDAFRFCGSMNHQFTQIGNAVPPLMAYAVAKNLRRQLTDAVLESQPRLRKAVQPSNNSMLAKGLEAPELIPADKHLSV